MNPRAMIDDHAAGNEPPKLDWPPAPVGNGTPEEPVVAQAPLATVPFSDMPPEFWRGVIAVLMEAPIPGRIVAPLTTTIERHLIAAGHSV